jgi:ferritin-like metal-binding protein YciE
MKIKTLQDLFIHELSDMYNAEKQLTKALPKMAKAASNPALAAAFESHLTETEGQIGRLERVFEICEVKPHHEKCEATEGLIEEAKEIIDHTEAGPVRDAGLISSAQKIEHYEIASYGTLSAIAEKLGHTEAQRLIDQTLAQEKMADKKLNELALGDVNADAMRKAA